MIAQLIARFFEVVR